MEITAKIAINAKKIKNIYLIRVLGNKKLNYIIKNMRKANHFEFSKIKNDAHMEQTPIYYASFLFY